MSTESEHSDSQNFMQDRLPGAEPYQVVSELFVLEESEAPMPADAAEPEEEALLLALAQDAGTEDSDARLFAEAREVTAPAAAPLWKDPDADLTSAFLAGSDEAFIQIYAKYEAPLLLYCKRMMSNEFIAEDAFQEIWIKVFELRQKPGIVISCFRALLFRSARNFCFNMIRVERLRAGSSDQMQNVVSPDQPESDWNRRELRSLIRQALGKLPFDQREAFVMHEYSGYSYGEIADIMGTNEVNVKVRAYRARTRLRKLIQGWLGLAETDDPSNVI